MEYTESNFRNFLKCLKLNKGKTEAIINQNDGTLEHNLSLGIKWINRPFKTLGTWFSLDNEEMINLNKNDKILIIKNILNSWSLRRLTLKGKVTVIKSFVLPHIVQLVSAIRFSKNLLKTLDEILYNFIWNQKKPLLSKITLIQPIEQGGMSMVSISKFINAAKIMFFKRFCNGIDANWKILTQNLMGLCTEELLRNELLKTQCVSSRPHSIKICCRYGVILWRLNLQVMLSFCMNHYFIMVYLQSIRNPYQMSLLNG